MKNTRDIRRHIKSVNNTQQITRAMKLVAASKSQRADARLKAYLPFYQGMEQLLNLVMYDGKYSDLAVFRPGRGKPCYLVISSDLGLAGGYNANLLRYVIDKADQDTCFVTIGQKGRDFLRFRQRKILAQYVQIGDFPSYEQAKDMGRLVLEFFNEGIISSLTVIHIHARTLLSQEVKAQSLLPIIPTSDRSDHDSVLYEPSVKLILEQIVPDYIQSQLYGALLDARVAEFASRMIAMDAATDNAQELMDELELSLNRARQQAITTELIEVVSGAEAL